ncbi:MAG: hypothetical protein JWM98_2684 [Thermoleophilia bacterium]|nr:hypothetical protein [Thermoleophilia bacterium]
MMGGTPAAGGGVAQLGAPLPTTAATATGLTSATTPVGAPIKTAVPGTPGATGAAGAIAPAGAAAAPVAKALSPLAAQLIDSAATGTEGSSVAQQVFSSLKSNGAQITTMDDAQFAAKYGDRTAGLFDPSTNGIVVPTRVAQDPAKLRLILLHEGVHWLQDNVQGGAEGLGGPIGQALQGAGAVRQTQAVTKADSQHDEAQAYLVEALTANQLGIKDAGLGVDASGKALNYDAILAKVASTPEYQ